ncbi:MAG: cyclic nucleotide-binding domain-containing protein [Armatimonadetes bacterium]|nr:cyclic nucleotide-binding domain-containing protein [Armatimonadota bacterium]
MHVSEIISNGLGRGLDELEVGALVAVSKEKVLEGGEVIARQYERGGDLIMILRGTALVKGFGGEVMAELGPGAVIGEISLVDDEPRSASVVCKGQVTTAVFPRRELVELFKRQPMIEGVIMRNIARVLCSRLRAANIQLDSMLTAGAASV